MPVGSSSSPPPPPPALVAISGSWPWERRGEFFRSRCVGICPGVDGKRSFSPKQLVAPCHCSAKGDEEVDFLDEGQKLPVEAGKIDSSVRLMEKLRRYGIAGVLSYGLLNTVYYLISFLSVWLYFAPAPGKLGYAASVERVLKIMAAVWAGSQVTKLLRAAGALALAPLVEKGLSWFTIKFKFDSQGKERRVDRGLGNNCSTPWTLSADHPRGKTTQIERTRQVNSSYLPMKKKASTTKIAALTSCWRLDSSSTAFRPVRSSRRTIP
ncbi:unnamed protein product [Spirodela intermedia]|uniref:Uncharacterized protein n=1 Tax=Spirodela intermedia TaxID=51605 RepID=A0A7I8J374_SPIIN|nr:unnamed protein product [Spirodela intermedia]CAA6664656.1 unnamed protein product [Spirodela intermedia]